jgi:predicted TIM-barrel fold metal-dependent hydrolase
MQPDMHRRRFLTHAATALIAAHVSPSRAGDQPPGADAGLIDTNTWFSHWPTHHGSPDSTAALVSKLRRHGVSSAWIGSFDGALDTDVAGVNTRLAEACVRDGGGILVPFGTVNPALPDWEEDLRRCHEVHGMRGLRLFPNYHGYSLDDARFVQLVELATRRGLLVQIAVSVEDDRSQDPVLRVAPVVVAPLADIVERNPKTRAMILNGAGASRILTVGNPLLRRLAVAGVLFETATLEGVAGIEALLAIVPHLRLTFGSHSPYFYFEAALLKLQESALTSGQLMAIRSGCARTALVPKP